MLKRVRFGILLLGVFSNSVLVGGESAIDLYSKKATWETTMLDARTKVCDTFKKAPFLRQGDWYLAGPYKTKSFEELHIDLKKPIDLTVKDSKKKQLIWNKKDFQDETIHHFKNHQNSAYYLFRTMTVSSAREIGISLGSDDGIEVWANGKKLLSKQAGRGVEPNQEYVEVKLKKGRNELILKVVNCGSETGFWYSAGENLPVEMWKLISTDFPNELVTIASHTGDTILKWLRGPDAVGVEKEMLNQIAFGKSDFAKRITLGYTKISNPVGRLTYILKACATREALNRAEEGVSLINIVALKRAIKDLMVSHPIAYKNGAAMMGELDCLAKDIVRIKRGLVAGNRQAFNRGIELVALQKKALLSNPDIDFDKILLVKRVGRSGLTNNWNANSSIHGSFDNEICTISLKDLSKAPTAVYKSGKQSFVGDVDLHFDGNKMLFSSKDAPTANWHVYEVGIDGKGLRKVTKKMLDNDVDSYDPCYLADDRIMFAATTGFQGVPCVGGTSYVANLHVMNYNGSNIRRLTFDQENNWCPTLLENGRILFLRWEYTDSAHYFSRVLMHMNPDGTNQVEFYGSNSYWPNSIFYARQIPGKPSKFVGIVTGHHGVAREGELVLFDAARGRHETDGAVQKIPGYGKKIENITRDNLVDSVKARFIHPYPISEKYFLVSHRPKGAKTMGIYLCDIYDNILLLKEIPGANLYEPIPLKAQKRPQIIKDRVNLKKKTATVFIQDVNRGQALRGVPRGTVKYLRVFKYIYAYRGTGGHYAIGMEGPWDVRHVLGTVPVYDDGSVSFEIPANTPIAIQPLDADGRALAHMRSWVTAQPGEHLSCVGCHEKQNNAPPPGNPIALKRAPLKLKPFYGPTRGFCFRREVQPVLDKFCVGCHAGSNAIAKKIPDFKDDGTLIGFLGAGNRYSKPYLNLHPYVRRNGPEGDYHVLTPLEFHVSTSKLIQLLDKGHHGVTMDAESMDRLVTWIDLNVPFYGSWKEAAPKLTVAKNKSIEQRLEMKKRYSNLSNDDVETLHSMPQPVAYVKPTKAEGPSKIVPTLNGWPFDAAAAKAKQGGNATMSIDLGDGQNMEFVRVPAGSFVMGSTQGYADELPMSVVEIKKAYWIAKLEVSNQQYALFDAVHDSGVYDMHYKDQVKRGYFVNQPEMPVIRISWNRAVEFCEWLSKKTGKKINLPTEAQWEYACRAGSSSELAYGPVSANFSAQANLADVSIKKLAVQGVDPQPIRNPNAYMAYEIARHDCNDKVLHLAKPGQYKANAWGIHDMHGNVAEWTLSTMKSYPYSDDDGRNAVDRKAKKVIRGGAWSDRPRNARSAYRLAFPTWQQVFNVGFRVVIEE